MMPESYERLLPAQPLPSYKYTSETAASLPGTAAAHKLVVAIRQKCTPEEVLNELKDLPNPRDTENDMVESTLNPLKIDVFVQTLLNLGSKSFSHTFAAISKFHYVFKQLADSEEGQICVLHNVFELWNNHQQMMVVIVDKLLKTQVVECSSVATWVFSKEMSSEFTKMYLWEILHLTIKKMNKHVMKLSADLAEAKEKLARDAESSSSDESDGDNPTKKKKDNSGEKPTDEVKFRCIKKLFFF